MVQTGTVYLYIFSTSGPLLDLEKSELAGVLKDSLSSFFRNSSPSPTHLTQLHGTIYEDPTTSNLTVKVTPDSLVPLIVRD